MDWLLALVDGVRHFYVGHDETSVMEVESTMRNFFVQDVVELWWVPCSRGLVSRHR